MTNDTTGDHGEVSGSRRRFVRGAVAAGAVGGLGGFAGLAAGQADATTYKLRAEAEGWRGRKPKAIEKTVNPTLDLRPGERYELVWENADDRPHNFALLDQGGSVLEETDFAPMAGGTRTLEFTATEEMTRYRCLVHPVRMKGQISTGGEK